MQWRVTDKSGQNKSLIETQQEGASRCVTVETVTT